MSSKGDTLDAGMPVTRVAPLAKRKNEEALSRSAGHGTSIEVAFQHIRHLIVHGSLAPGTWIIEADLSRRLGMSRTPVRSALQWLQREGYVIEQKARLNARMMVAPLTHEDARELYAIVARLEGLAGRLTAQLPRKQRLDAVNLIAPLNDQLQTIATTRQLEGRSIFDLDAAFHRHIVEAGAGPRLLSLHNAIKPQTERYWRLYSSNIVGQLQVAVEEHDRIILAIRKGEPELAEQSVIANWINGAERIAPVIAQHGDLGTW